MRAPPSMPLAIWIVLVVNTLVYSAHRGSKVAMTLLATKLGVSAAAIGLLASLYALVPTVLALVSGRWSDRFGVTAPLLLGTSLLGLALVVPVVWPSFAGLGVAAVLIGAGHIVYQVSMQNAVGHLSTEQTRVKHFAAYSLTVSLSAVLGPFVGAIGIDRFGYGGAFTLLAASALLGAALVVHARATFSERRLRPAQAHASDATPLLAVAALRRVIVVSALVMAAYDLFSFYLPLYGRSAGLSATAIGAVLAAFGAAGIVVRVVLPALVARIGDERLLSVCLLVSAFAYALMPMCTSAVGLALLSLLIGLTLGCGPALLVPMTYARAPEGRSGEALGLRLAASYGAHAAVPAALGSLGAWLGMAAIFWSNTAMLVAGVMYLARRERIKAWLRLPMTRAGISGGDTR